MLKKLVNGAKNAADDLAIKKAKKALIQSAEQSGINMTELLTPAIEEKFDDLARTIISEHGYVKLASMGLVAHYSK